MSQKGDPKERSRSPKDGGKTPPAASPSMDSIRTLIDDTYKKQQAQLVEVCNTNTRAVVTQITEGFANRLTSVEAKVDVIGEKLDKLLNRSQSMPTLSTPSLTSISQEGPGEDGPSQPSTTSGSVQGFMRAIDPTILYINIDKGTDVTLENLKKSFTELAVEANILESNFKIIGSDLASKFQVKFLGDFNTAKSRATQFTLSLRLGPGEYKKQETITPNGVSVSFFVNPDKNAAQVRTEVLAKKLRDYLGEICSGKTFFLRRSDGTIFEDRRALVQVQVLSNSNTRLAWKHLKRVALHIDQGQVEEKFKKLISEGDGEPWS